MKFEVFKTIFLFTNSFFYILVEEHLNVSKLGMLVIYSMNLKTRRKILDESQNN